MEAADRVVLLSGSGVFGCFPIYDRIKRRGRERGKAGIDGLSRKEGD